jgi:hypothetical protein
MMKCLKNGIIGKFDLNPRLLSVGDIVLVRSSRGFLKPRPAKQPRGH